MKLVFTCGVEMGAEEPEFMKSKAFSFTSYDGCAIRGCGWNPYIVYDGVMFSYAKRSVLCGKVSVG